MVPSIVSMVIGAIFMNQQVDTPSTNPFRQACEQNRPLIGIWSMLNSSPAVEGLSECGYDWILIDGEHSPVSLSDAIGHLRALRGSPTMPIVRLAWNDPVLIKQFLDAGAMTLMLPYVQDAREAEKAVAAMRYPPYGIRGVAAIHRASRYGRDTDYFANARDAVSLIVQIETERALDNIVEIAGTDGVDSVFFGPGDLAATMGLLGQPSAPRVVEAILKGRERISHQNVHIGALAPTPELGERFIREGFDFVAVANDVAILLSNASAIAARFRDIHVERKAG